MWRVEPRDQLESALHFCIVILICCDHESFIDRNIAHNCALFSDLERLLYHQPNQSHPFPHTPEPELSRLESGSWAGEENLFGKTGPGVEGHQTSGMIRHLHPRAGGPLQQPREHHPPHPEDEQEQALHQAA